MDVLYLAFTPGLLAQNELACLKLQEFVICMNG